MQDILRRDAPWSFGYFPYAAGAYQAWVRNGKPSILVRDMLRYHRLDTDLRARRIHEWNHPVAWPLAAIGLALAAVLALGARAYRARERATARAPAA